VAVNILDHDDGVVDQDADGERQCQHGQHVEGEAHGLDEGEGGDDRDWQGGGADQGRAPVVQEEQDDQDGQHGTVDKVETDVVDHVLDERRIVDGNRDGHALGELGPQFFHHGFHAVGDLDGVRAGLLAHQHGDGRGAIQGGVGTTFLRAVFHPGHVPDAHRRAARRRDDDVLQLAGRVHLAAGFHRKLALAHVQPAARDLHVLRGQHLDHVAHRQTVRFQPARIDPHLELALLAADDVHAAHAVDGLQPLLDVVLGQRGQIAFRQRTSQRQRHDGSGVDVQALDDGRLQILGQVFQRAGHLVAHVLHCLVGSAFQLELHEHQAHAFHRCGAQGLDAVYRADRFLQLVDDTRFDGLGIGAWVHRGHGDDGELDLRHHVEGDLGIGPDAEHRQHADHHGREDRTANGDIS
jgi:hypothetical protein